MRHPLGGRRLALRVFSLGVVLLASSAALFALVGHWMVRAPNAREVAYFTRALSVEACTRALTAPTPHSESVAPLHLPAWVTVYRDDGRLLARGEGPTPPPLRGAALAALGTAPTELAPDLLAHRCPSDPQAYVLVGRPQRPFAARKLAGVFAAVLLALALLSLPLARAIAAPVEAIAAVTRRFGHGDLSARAEIPPDDDLGDLAAAFNDMAARLEGAVRAERELLANVSHELRTPLARIRVVLETAQENPARAQRLLHEISTDLADLERLVEDVMAAVRLDLGGMKYHATALPVTLAPLDLAPLLADAAERFRTLHAPRTLTLDAPDAGLAVDGDGRLLRRLVDNLVDNARKYADGEITVRAHTDGDRVVVAVEDRGEGIAPEDLARVFTPFFRADRSRTRGTGGVGLGLALARRIAEAHHGELRLESAPGQGTRAVFSLPLKQTDTRG